MNEIAWEKLFNLSYWLEGIAGTTSITPVVERDSFFFWTYLNVFAIIFAIGVVLRVAQVFLHSKHPFQNKLPLWGNTSMWVGFLGLVWFTLRQLQVAFLGARFWLLFMLIWVLVVLYISIRYFMIYYPLENSYYKSIKNNKG